MEVLSPDNTLHHHHHYSSATTTTTNSTTTSTSQQSRRTLSPLRASTHNQLRIQPRRSHPPSRTFSRHFDIVSKDDGVSLVAFTLKDNSRFNEFQVSDLLRRFGWIVPAYTMPPDAHVTVLRVVIQEDFPRTLAKRLAVDVEKVLHELDMLPPKVVAVNGEEATTSSNGKVKKTVMETQREIIAV
nr:glutamate decarboxylase 3-like [Arachis hypogaea]